MKKESLISNVKLGDIELLPNIRANYDKETLHELSQSILENGIITPLLIRIHPEKKGKYQLVAGKRRYLAAGIAKLQEVPVHLREIEDADIEQLQVLENLQRLDIHPLDEAVGYKILSGKLNGAATSETIARKVGKTPHYVATRLKLNDLIPDYIKAFREDRMHLFDAVRVSKLSESDQKHLFKEHNHATGNININNWTFNKFLGDLTKAPFDIKDPSLDKKMGACISCKFNTATNTVLFPDQAHEATCMNSGCFKHKADISFDKRFNEALNDPTMVLICDGYSLTKDAQLYIKKGHKVLSKNEYSELEAPELPNREDDLDEDDTKEEQEKHWKMLMKEYEEELAGYNKKISSGKLIRGFSIDGDHKGKISYIELSKASSSSRHEKAAAKSKVESGEASSEDIKAVIQGIRDREKRAKELDYEKISAKISEELAKNKNMNSVSVELSKDEIAAMHVAIAKKMGGFNIHRKVELYLKGDGRAYLETTKKLNAKQLAHLVRMVLFDEYKNTYKEQWVGSKILRALAGGVGIDIKAIEKAQAEIASARAERVEKRISDLKAQIKPAGKKSKK